MVFQYLKKKKILINNEKTILLKHRYAQLKKYVLNPINTRPQSDVVTTSRTSLQRGIDVGLTSRAYTGQVWFPGL